MNWLEGLTLLFFFVSPVILIVALNPFVLPSILDLRAAGGDAVLNANYIVDPIWPTIYLMLFVVIITAIIYVYERSRK